MAFITITNEIQDYNLSYGYNMVSLFDTESDNNIERYVLRVFDAVTDNQVGDIRQIPNVVGYTHTDIQRILQNYTTSNPTLDTTLRLHNGEYEVFEYYMRYGTQQGSEIILTGLTTNKVVIGGRKEYDQLYWDNTEYIIQGYNNPFGGLDNFIVTQQASALTDRPYGIIEGGDITDGKPGWISNSDVVRTYDILSHQDYTLSFMNDVKLTSGQSSLPPHTNGINGYFITAYNGDTQVVNNYVYNLLGNGGGPDEVNGDTTQPFGKYLMNGIQIGNRNPLLVGLTYTHLYIQGFAWTNGFDENVNKTDVTPPYRINIVDGECNDFEPIEISWLNSFGVRDYFVFQKRKDERSSIERTTYDKTNTSWAGSTFEVNTYDRGKKVFNQGVTERYTLNTRYLTDEEMTWLKNLYYSPDVRVRFFGESVWRPVVLTSNQWTERTFRKDRLFQNTIEFEMSNKNIIQKG